MTQRGEPHMPMLASQKADTEAPASQSYSTTLPSLVSSMKSQHPAEGELSSFGVSYFNPGTQEETSLRQVRLKNQEEKPGTDGYSTGVPQLTSNNLKSVELDG